MIMGIIRRRRRDGFSPIREKLDSFVADRWNVLTVSSSSPSLPMKREEMLVHAWRVKYRIWSQTIVSGTFDQLTGDHGRIDLRAETTLAVVVLELPVWLDGVGVKRCPWMVASSSTVARAGVQSLFSWTTNPTRATA